MIICTANDAGKITRKIFPPNSVLAVLNIVNITTSKIRRKLPAILSGLIYQQ
jgi:hypothetical protein